MVEGGQYHVVADEGAVPDGDAPLVLELAAHVDKDVFPHMDVFAAVGVEGGEKAKALIHRPAGELGEEGAQLLGLVVAAVDFSCQAQGLLADGVHELVDLAAPLHRRPAVQMLQKLV